MARAGYALSLIHIFRGLVDQSDKEFTVVFSSAELERMASDEKYAQEKLSMVKTAVGSDTEPSI